VFKVVQVAISFDGVQSNQCSTASRRLPFRSLQCMEWYGQAPDSKWLVTAIQDNAQLEALRIRQELRLPDGFIDALCLRAATLTTLLLEAGGLTDSDLQQIGAYCKSLTVLQLTVGLCQEALSQVTDAGITSLAVGCTQLQFLLIFGFPLSEASTLAVFTHCLQLDNLHVWGLPVQDTAIYALCADDRAAAVQRLTCCWEASPLIDTLWFARAFSALTQLTLSSLTEYSISALCSALYVMPSLRELTISSDSSQPIALPVAVLEAIAEGCTMLKVLKIEVRIHGDAEPGLVNIAVRNPGLTGLDVTNVAVGVTDAVVLALATHCAQLTRLRLHSAKLLTDTSLTALARSCPRLNHLALSHCAQLTDRTILALAAHCPGLQELYLAGSTRLRQTALEQLLISCKDLLFLNVSSVSIVESAVERLQRGMRSEHAQIVLSKISTSAWVAAKATRAVTAMWIPRI
jgi:hypothetical protein